jgi:class 3 adenylate cyclase
MLSLDHVPTPVTAEFLVSYTDIRGFTRLAKAFSTSERIFTFLDGIAHLMATTVGPSSGRIIKFIGDGALLLFPGEDTDSGVRMMMTIKEAVDTHIAALGHDSRVAVSAHYGEATIGPFGPEKRLDVIGEAVNRAFITERLGHGSEFTITPETFRKLATDTRKLFRKYTPPVVYLMR